MPERLPYTKDEIIETYNRHVDTVYRVCFAYMKNVADTEDAVQDTFVKLISCGKRFESYEHEKAWLIVTATNVCKDHYRHWWNKRESLNDYENIIVQPSFEIDDTLKTIMDLPDKYKTVIYLYYYDGYDSGEIANMLHKPQSTVRYYLSKGRDILRRKLGGVF